MSETYRVPTRDMSICHRVLGVAALTNEVNFVETAYEAITGQPTTFDRFVAEKGRLLEITMATGDSDASAYELDPGVIQDAVTHITLEAALTENPQRYENVMVRWPSYVDLYRRFAHANVREHTVNNPRRALLIGGYPLSSAAFIPLAADEYGVMPGNAYIADPLVSAYGRNTPVNGLALPDSWNATMDIVQTNSLMHMVLGTDLRLAEMEDAGELSTLVQLFENAFRVLRPGGYLFMHESAPGYDWIAASKSVEMVPENQQRVSEFSQHIRAALTLTGFKVDTIEGARNIVGNQYLFDASRNFAAYRTTPCHAALAICANKPGGELTGSKAT